MSMNDPLIEAFVSDYPTERLAPEDGMDVDAAAWQDAHDFHQQRDRFHTRLGGGPGILLGLEVGANAPAPDKRVFVNPGLAVDHLGHLIVVKTRTTVDVGSAPGMLRIVVWWNETQPYSQNDEADPHRKYRGDRVNFKAIAQTPALNQIELARIRHTGDVSVIDAGKQHRPGDNEIDLRYRPELRPRAQPIVSVGVMQIGGRDPNAAASLYLLAQAAEALGGPRVCVDADLKPADADANAYDLVYLRVNGAFDAADGEVQKIEQSLRPHVAAGRALFVELNHAVAQNGNAQAAVEALCTRLTGRLDPITLMPDHQLLSSPYLFARLPDGLVQTPPSPAMWLSANRAHRVALSAVDVGGMWRGGWGESNSNPPAREAIRAAHEWGINLLRWASDSISQNRRLS